MKKKVLVFGATGNLGAPIAVYLKENGYDVIAVDIGLRIMVFLEKSEYPIIL